MPVARASARACRAADRDGSAASAVACFLHDLDGLRQGLVVLDGGEEPAGAQRIGSARPPQPVTQRTNKAPIIRNPMIVDADR